MEEEEEEEEEVAGIKSQAEIEFHRNDCGWLQDKNPEHFVKRVSVVQVYPHL
jgi:hypothetical protein